MRRSADTDEVALVIVGCGAGGSTLLQRLARAGWQVVGMDAGPFWDPDADWVSDEAGSHHPSWTQPRGISGTDPGPTRPRSARTTPAGAWAARWCITPATRRGSTPATSPRSARTASAPTGR